MNTKRIHLNGFWLPAGAVALAASLALSACNLDVSTPDVIPPEATAGAAALPTLLAGASGDFSVAFTGYSNGDNSDGIIHNSGLMSDEFIATDYFNTHVELDSRSVHPTNGAVTRVMRNLVRSIVSAQTTADRYKQFAPDEPGFARALNLAGIGYVLAAENFCSGVPFSSINPDGSYNFGSPKTTVQMLDMAIAKFDSAIQIAQTADDDLMRFTAMVGKGRALLDRGDYAAAAAAAAGVPTSFRFTTEHGTANDRTKNGIYELTWVSTRLTEADQEGGNGLPFVSSGDPRTSADPAGESDFDAGTPLFPPNKYASYTAPVVIADGIEARLIEAEAALAANYAGPNGTFAILNGLRSSAGLNPLAPALTAAAQQDQLFTERAFWMFGTAHRLGDLRRLVRQYGRAESSVFPTGDYFKGGPYGHDVSMPVPQEEENNPNFSRAACNTAQP